jgi:predicted RNA polymerase sigma factor
MVPFDLMDPWMGTIIDSELDNTVEQTTLIILTSLCESRLAATAEMPTVLFLIHNQEDSMWQQCLVAVSDSEGPH